jgi:hypothetical protein
VITLAVNKGLAVFKIMGGDTDKFTLSGSSFMNYNKLTFKATALEVRIFSTASTKDLAALFSTLVALILTR